MCVCVTQLCVKDCVCDKVAGAKAGVCDEVVFDLIGDSSPCQYPVRMCFGGRSRSSQLAALALLCASLSGPYAL